MKKQNRCLLYFLVFIFSLVLTCACSSNDDEDQPLPDGDRESASDGDAAADGDDPAPDGDDSGTSFEYEKCAERSEVIQYPSPAWENEGMTLTGVEILPPAGDKAASLLLDVREAWHADFPTVDGFPLSAEWIVALSGEASDIDSSKIALYRQNGDNVEVVSDVELFAELSEDGMYLMVATVGPMAVPDQGDRSILAIYENAVSGAKPLPACDGEAAHQSYVEAAIDLIDAGFGEKLLFALPTTHTRIPYSHRVLFDSLVSDPQLVVKQIDRHTDWTDFEDFAPEESIRGLLKEAYMGLLNLPNYQNADGHFELDMETGKPISVGVTEPGFLVILPQEGEAPYPTVLFQHGGGMEKRDAFKVVELYAEKGMAIVAIDLPYHGDRAEAGRTGGAADMADFTEPLKTRDNFRQASADHLAVLTGIAALNEAIRTAGGVEGALDANRLFYVGHSMGSISGTLTTSVADNLSGSSLIAGGAPYKVLISDGLFSMMILDIIGGRPDVETHLLMSQIQTLLDGGDPINFPQHLENRQMRPKSVLVWEIIGDPVAINASTAAQAVAFGAQLAAPSYVDVSGQDAIDAPIQNNFGWVSDGERATRVFKQIDFPEVSTADKHLEILLDPVSHESASRCFSALAEGGDCVYEGGSRR